MKGYSTWYVINGDVIHDNRLTDAEKYFALIIRTLAGSGYCFAGNRYLCETYGWSERKVQENLRKLESLGIVRIEYHGKPGSQSRHVFYNETPLVLSGEQDPPQNTAGAPRKILRPPPQNTAGIISNNNNISNTDGGSIVRSSNYNPHFDKMNMRLLKDAVQFEFKFGPLVLNSRQWKKLLQSGAASSEEITDFCEAVRLDMVLKCKTKSSGAQHAGYVFKSSLSDVAKEWAESEAAMERVAASKKRTKSAGQGQKSFEELKSDHRSEIKKQKGEEYERIRETYGF